VASAFGEGLVYLRSLVFVACVVVLVATGCRHSSNSAHAIDMQFNIAPRPPHVGAATIAIKLTNAGANPITGVHVQLEGDMSHPGMAPVFGDAREVAPGHFEGKLQLTMAGDWVVLVHITLANGEKIERQVDVRGVQPN
jgi:hypothetical protein